jgi:hypothetical protein
MSKAPTGSGSWLKAADLKKGDTALITGEANWEKSEYNGTEVNQYVGEVEYNGEKRKLKFTMASCNEIAPIYGEDSNDWIGKIVNLEAVKVMVSGKMKLSILATPANSTPKKTDDKAWDDA